MICYVCDGTDEDTDRTFNTGRTFEGEPVCESCVITLQETWDEGNDGFVDRMLD